MTGALIFALRTIVVTAARTIALLPLPPRWTLTLTGFSRTTGPILTVTQMGTVHSIGSFWTFLLALWAGEPGTAQTRAIYVRTLGIIFALA